MPHCIIEYGKSLEELLSITKIMDVAKQSCIASELFSPKDIKVRAVPYPYFLPAGQEECFIHVILKILPGRSGEQKSLLSHLILDGLTQLALEKVSLTVEVCDLDKVSYAKKIVLS